MTALPRFRDKEIRADISVHLLSIFATIVACGVLLPFDRSVEDTTALLAVSLYLVGLFAMLFAGRTRPAAISCGAATRRRSCC